MLEGLDWLLVECSRRGLRLLLSLTNFWGDYGGMPQYVRCAAAGACVPHLQGFPVASKSSTPRALQIPGCLPQFPRESLKAAASCSKAATYTTASLSHSLLGRWCEPVCEPSSAPAERFYSSASCQAAFQRFLSALVLRVNTISGKDCAFHC